jgi:hypothetical protein
LNGKEDCILDDDHDLVLGLSARLKAMLAQHFLSAACFGQSACKLGTVLIVRCRATVEISLDLSYTLVHAFAWGDSASQG